MCLIFGIVFVCVFNIDYVCVMCYYKSYDIFVVFLLFGRRCGFMVRFIDCGKNVLLYVGMYVVKKRWICFVILGC